MYDFLFGIDFEGIDYVDVVCGFGCYGEWVMVEDEIGFVFVCVMVLGLLVVIDCCVCFEVYFSMFYFVKMNVYGF